MSQSAFFPVKPSMRSYILIGNRVLVKSSGIACLSKARELPRGLQMPSPRAVRKVANTPGTDKAGKYPAVAGGGGGWAQVELTDA